MKLLNLKCYEMLKYKEKISKYFILIHHCYCCLNNCIVIYKRIRKTIKH